MSGEVTHRRRDGGEIDDRRTMNLPEAVRIELLRQLFQGCADERFTFGGEDTRVLVGRLEVADFLDGNQTHLVSDRSSDPRQPSRPRPIVLTRQDARERL